MKIILKEKKETIHVLHNNQEEMTKNLIQLKEEGWSDNVRPFIREEIREADIEEVKRLHPNVEVQYPSSTNPFGRLPYVYVTQHEREIKE